MKNLVSVLCAVVPLLVMISVNYIGYLHTAALLS